MRRAAFAATPLLVLSVVLESTGSPWEQGANDYERQEAIQLVRAQRDQNSRVLSDPTLEVLQIVCEGDQFTAPRPVLHLRYDAIGLLDAYAEGKIVFQTESGHRIPPDDMPVLLARGYLLATPHVTTTSLGSKNLFHYEDLFETGRFRIIELETGGEVPSLVQYELQSRIVRLDSQTGMRLTREQIRSYEADATKTMRTFVIPSDVRIEGARLRTLEDVLSVGGGEVVSGVNQQQLRLHRAREVVEAANRQFEMDKKIMHATLVAPDGRPIRYYADSERVEADRENIESRVASGARLIGDTYQPYTLVWGGYQFDGHVHALVKDRHNNVIRVLEERNGRLTWWSYEQGAWSAAEGGDSVEEMRAKALYLAVSIDGRHELLRYADPDLVGAPPTLVFEEGTGNEILFRYDGRLLDEARADLELLGQEIERVRRLARGRGDERQLAEGDRIPGGVPPSEYVRLLVGWGGEVVPGGVQAFDSLGDLPSRRELNKAEDGNWYRKGGVRYEGTRMLGYDRGNRVIVGRLAARQTVRLMEQGRENVDEWAIGVRRGRVARTTLSSGWTTVLTGRFNVDWYRRGVRMDTYDPVTESALRTYRGREYLVTLEDALIDVEEILQMEGQWLRLLELSARKVHGDSYGPEGGR